MKKEMVLITGAAGGIGKVCAYALKDYQLIVTDYDEKLVQDTIEELSSKGYDVDGVACDITDQSSIDNLVNFTKEKGELKAMVNVAGVSGTVNNTKMVYDINLVASYHLVQSFKPLFKKEGVMVLFSSMMGHTIPANENYDNALRNPHLEESFETVEPFVEGDADSMYNFTKRGVLLLTKDFAKEYGEKGVRIVSVSPGVIMTEMAKKALEEHPEVMEQTLNMTPLNRYGQPEDIANAVKFLISDEAGFITGTDLLIDGGVTTQF